MKIHITNKTNWQTQDLRRFVACAAKTIEHTKQNAYVTFVHTRGQPKFWRQVDGKAVPVETANYSSGHATLNGNTLTIRVHPKTPDKIDLAYVIGHELAHNKGLTHPQMRGNAYFDRVAKTREVYAWGDSLPLAPRDLNERKPKSSAESKLAHANLMLKQSKTRAKRAETFVKKWTRKVKCYEKQIVKGQSK